MINNLFLIICLVAATTHYLIRRKSYTSKLQVIDLYLLYLLVFTVGLVGLSGFIGHVFFADQVAKLIGWAPGSPFQFEVGFHDGAWALLGFLCIFIRGNFWLATGLGWSFFMLGASYGHIHQMIVNHNFAPYNAGIIFSDSLIPFLLLLFLYLKYRWSKPVGI